MTDLDQSAEPIDGRIARRQRNVDAVIDVVLEMFAEESMFPTIEQAATRSGLSLRSLYRYFADPGELLEAAILRSRKQGYEMTRLPRIGEGEFETRLLDFVDMRLRLHAALGPVYRATIANAAQHPRVLDELARNRNAMREQFALQFAPELSVMAPADRDDALSAGDLIAQLDSIEYLRRHRALAVAKTRRAMLSSLRSLLS